MLDGVGYLLEAVHVAVFLAHGVRYDEEGGALEEHDLVRVAHTAQPLELRGERLSVRDERVHLVGVGVRVRVEVGVGIRIRVGARVRVGSGLGLGLGLGCEAGDGGGSSSCCDTQGAEAGGRRGEGAEAGGRRGEGTSRAKAGHVQGCGASGLQ